MRLLRNSTVDLGPGTAYAVRGETDDPKPDFIGGNTPEERAARTVELYAALEESAIAANALFGACEQSNDL